MRLIKLWDYQRILMGLHLTPQKMPPIIWVKKKTKFYLFYFFILFFWNWSILSLAKIGKMANIIVKGFHYISDVTLNLFPNCLEFCTFYIHYTILYYTIHVVCVSLPILPQHNLDFPFQDKGNKKKINMWSKRFYLLLRLPFKNLNWLSFRSRLYWNWWIMRESFKDWSIKIWFSSLLLNCLTWSRFVLQLLIKSSLWFEEWM